MKLRSAKDIIQVARERGYQIVVNPGPPPMPMLRDALGKDKPVFSEALLGALKAWRLEIIEEVSKTTEGNGAA